jgi:hypothetical protein
LETRPLDDSPEFEPAIGERVTLDYVPHRWMGCTQPAQCQAIETVP